MNKVTSGDLAFLPSDLTLLQFADVTDKVPQKWTRLSSTAHVLVLEDKKDSPYCTILYNGERWSVPKSKVYPIEKGV